MTRFASIAALLALSLAACKGDPTGGSAPTGSAAATTSKGAEITCDAVLAKIQSMTKVDDDGKKMLLALCAGQSQEVRACMVAAKTTKDLNACDPHPLARPASAPAGAAPEEQGEFDLASADPAWKGWVAMGPKSAKVLADGVHGARIAANGMDAFDLTFAPAKTRLSDRKKGIQDGQKFAGASTKTTFLVDSSDKLEWVMEGSTFKAWNFVWNMKASGKDVTCASGPQGASSEARLAELKKACETLRKK